MPYYHARLSTKRRKTTYIQIADLTRQELEKVLLRPYREGGAIFLDGQIVVKEDIHDLHVYSTRDPFKGAGIFVSFSRFIEREATDVTERYINDQAIQKQVGDVPSPRAAAATKRRRSNLPSEVFFSYSHKDGRLMERLETALANLKRQNIITAWHDRDIDAGSDWKKEIDTHLNSAQLILLLVSPDFMASEYCYSIEMRRAMARREAREAIVIPVILRPADWKGAPFGKLQALPPHGKAVTTWTNRDEAFLAIANGIRRAIERRVRSLARPATSTRPHRRSGATGRATNARRPQ